MVSTLNEQIVQLTSNGNKKTKELKKQMVQIQQSNSSSSLGVEAYSPVNEAIVRPKRSSKRLFWSEFLVSDYEVLYIYSFLFNSLIF